MKSLLISPGLGRLCTDGFIQEIYSTYSPDFAKCWYNNVSAVASWVEADNVPSNTTGLLVNSTSDNAPGLSTGLLGILYTLFALCVVGSITSCVCISDRCSKRGGTGPKENEMKLLGSGVQETATSRFI